MKALKYIFVEDHLGTYDFRCGYVEFHRHLLTSKEYSYTKVNGGGKFEIEIQNKRIKLYGKSDDFGYPKDIEKVLRQCYVQLMNEIEEFYYYYTKDEIDTSEYTLVYEDEQGKEHIVKRK